ncbi:NADH-ubiquinone oxidoreductase-F iron-sulfur binding region domain-containing protein [Shigella flexneri]
MDFEHIGKAGSRLGTALAMAVDNEINMVSLTRNLEDFFARESCGWCTPCRDGLPWSVKILRAIRKGRPAGRHRTLSNYVVSSDRVKPSAHTHRAR